MNKRKLIRLKTLKDIEERFEEGDLFCYSKDLKEEAIKRFIKVNDEGRIIDNKDWVDFFNITEEDLNG